MCCTLDSSYLQYSNSSILQVLNGCSELTVDQASAVEALLAGGQTQYGYVSGSGRCVDRCVALIQSDMTHSSTLITQSSINVDRTDSEGPRHVAALSDLNLLRAL